MRVLVLADEIFASRERVMMSRLEVGLADEGIRVVHAVPERSGKAAQADLFSQTVAYSDVPMPFGDRFRARRLIQELEQLAPEGERSADVIHVFGGSCWNLARIVASRTGAAVVLEVWRAGLAHRATQAPWATLRDLVFLAPDPAIERMLRHAGAATVRAAPWGVHAADLCRQILPEDRVPGIMVVGGGRDAPSMHAVMEGLGAARDASGPFLVFMDARAARRAGVWPLAERLGLLERLSLIDELEGRRDLLLHGDVLVHPDRAGEQRSIMLDAMGSGMAVVAAADPNVSILQDGRTCRLVPETTGTGWGNVLTDVLMDRPRARQLGRSAWDCVRTERPVAKYVRSVLETYSWLTSKGTIPFPAGA